MQSTAAAGKKTKKPSKVTKKQQVLLDARKAYTEELASRPEGRAGPTLVNIQELYLSEEESLPKWNIVVGHYNLDTQQTSVTARVPLEGHQLTADKLMLWWQVPAHPLPVVLSSMSVYWGLRPIASIRLSNEERLIKDQHLPLVITVGQVYFERQQQLNAPLPIDCWYLTVPTVDFAMMHVEYKK